jgi:hypothetical protein
MRPNPLEITRGEGSCLIFKLWEADIPNNYNIEDILKTYSEFRHL